jgi:hypothetical protein
LPFIHAGQDFDLIGLLPLGGEFGLAGAALVQEGLDIRFRKRDARRRAIDDAADCRPVALAPSGDPEKMPECVVRHETSLRFFGAECQSGNGYEEREEAVLF